MLRCRMVVLLCKNELALYGGRVRILDIRRQGSMRELYKTNIGSIYCTKYLYIPEVYFFVFTECKSMIHAELTNKNNKREPDYFPSSLGLVSWTCVEGKQDG